MCLDYLETDPCSEKWDVLETRGSSWEEEFGEEATQVETSCLSVTQAVSVWAAENVLLCESNCSYTACCDTKYIWERMSSEIYL